MSFDIWLLLIFMFGVSFLIGFFITAQITCVFRSKKRKSKKSFDEPLMLDLIDTLFADEDAGNEGAKNEVSENESFENRNVTEMKTPGKGADEDDRTGN